MPKGVLAGRVTGLTEVCMELTLDDGTVWSLSGDPGTGVQVGSIVVAKVVKLAEGEGRLRFRPARAIGLGTRGLVARRDVHAGIRHRYTK